MRNVFVCCLLHLKETIQNLSDKTADGDVPSSSNLTDLNVSVESSVDGRFFLFLLLIGFNSGSSSIIFDRGATLPGLSIILAFRANLREDITNGVLKISIIISAAAMCLLTAHVTDTVSPITLPITHYRVNMEALVKLLDEAFKKSSDCLVILGGIESDDPLVVSQLENLTSDLLQIISLQTKQNRMARKCVSRERSQVELIKDLRDLMQHQMKALEVAKAKREPELISSLVQTDIPCIPLDEHKIIMVEKCTEFELQFKQMRIDAENARQSACAENRRLQRILARSKCLLEAQQVIVANRQNSCFISLYTNRRK